MTSSIPSSDKRDDQALEILIKNANVSERKICYLI